LLIHNLFYFIATGWNETGDYDGHAEHKPIYLGSTVQIELRNYKNVYKHVRQHEEN